MKKMISMVSALINMTRSATKKESVKMIFADNLPMATKFFVQHNFPGRSIAFVEKVTNNKGTRYVTTLNDSTMIEFSENGSWMKVDCRMGAVPATLVPDNVAAFINNYHPRVPLCKI